MMASPTIDGLEAFAYTIATDGPEGDGTLEWDSTTLVLVRIEAGAHIGLGYTYCDRAVLAVISSLKTMILGAQCGDVAKIMCECQAKVRNFGRSGIAACALSALDIALWDLKARWLDLPLVELLGKATGPVPVYGSGGFTTYDESRLRDQLAGWVEQGCRWVKMKVGADPDRDPDRIAAAKDAIGSAQLFVDANGAFTSGVALRFAASVEQAEIGWFEEPVTSDDEVGLRHVRGRLPPGMELAAGEYVYTLDDARRLLESESVDVLQCDVTRCGGITGFMKIAALAEAFHIDLSGHCAPSAHLHAASAAPRLRHLEWFHDHVRIEQMLFDGAATVSNGLIQPDSARAGLGLAFKFSDAERFRVQ